MKQNSYRGVAANLTAHFLTQDKLTSGSDRSESDYAGSGRISGRFLRDRFIVSENSMNIVLKFVTTSSGKMIAAGCLAAGCAIGVTVYLSFTPDPSPMVQAPERQERQSLPAPPPPVSQPEEKIMVVVNKSNPVTSMTVRQLARIYSGEVTEWPSGESITVINRPIQSAIREKFYRLVLHAKPTQKFFHSGSPIPFESQRVDSEASVPRFVTRDKNAIAYCYAPCSGVDVKTVPVEGFAFGESEFAFK
jgi:PBP superfamily domain